MPAPFAVTLLGFRVTGLPNTSDSNDDQSKELGNALLKALGINKGTIGPSDPGTDLENLTRDHLLSLRPDLEIARSRRAFEFQQYRHLAVVQEFWKQSKPMGSAVDPLVSLAEAVSDKRLRGRLERALAKASHKLRAQDAALQALRVQIPEESLLRIDLTVGESSEVGPPRLSVALSSKWTLRTDRAQDCLSQGSKLVSLRRGPMPHFGVITAECRPAMLRILADGSGAIDYVYHLHLPALEEAIDRVARSKAGGGWSPARTFRRMIDQGRLRDYDDLLAEVRRLPRVA